MRSEPSAGREWDATARGAGSAAVLSASAAYTLSMAAAESLSRDQFFSAAFLASPDMIAVSHLQDGTYFEVNDAFLAETGYPREEVIGRTSNDIRLWAEPDGRERFTRLLAREGYVRNVATRFRLKSGEVRQFQVAATIAQIEGRDCIISVSRDVTESNEMVERLEKSRFLLERAEEMANIGSWEFDYLAGRVTASSGAHRIYGLEPGQFSIEAVEAVPLPHYREGMDRARDALIREGRPYDIEFRIARRNDSAVRDIHSKARWDPANKRLFGIIRDVTEEKETAEGLRRALAEKETLIKELYHRTKNNMQVIISLLDLEAARAPEPQVRDVFGQVQRRIGSMSLVHEMLYRAKDLSRIDLREFIPSLVNLLRASLGDGEGRIAFVCEAEKVELLIDAALPCGIILNELVTNALTHAFPDGRRGTILVRSGRDEAGLVRIEVRDDGIGSPSGVSPEDMANLGLWLVSNIGQTQLRGSVRFDTGAGGFGCTLTFSDSLFESRV